MNSQQITDQLQLVDPATLQEWLEEDSVILVDVREPAEYASEHINGSVLIPLSNFDVNKIPAIEAKRLVLYCRSSNRSAQAAQKLFLSGIREVTHLRGGIEAWKQSGYPINKNRNAPISLMRQVQIVAGSLVLIGTLLGAFVSPWFLLLSGFVGGGLLFAGISNTCALAMLLAKLPYNRMGNGV